jgi:hypothetical protein
MDQDRDAGLYKTVRNGCPESNHGLQLASKDETRQISPMSADRPPRDRYTGPLPTIAGGVTSISVYCSQTHGCGRSGEAKIADLGFPDDMPFAHMAATGRFKCSACDCRDTDNAELAEAAGCVWSGREGEK